MAPKHSDSTYIAQLEPAGSCSGCRQRDRVIKQVVREQAALADLAILQRDQLARLPGPVAVARRLVKQFTDAELDTLAAEIIRLKS